MPQVPDMWHQPEMFLKPQGRQGILNEQTLVKQDWGNCGFFSPPLPTSHLSKRARTQPKLCFTKWKSPVLLQDYYFLQKFSQDKDSIFLANETLNIWISRGCIKSPTKKKLYNSSQILLLRYRGINSLHICYTQVSSSSRWESPNN